MSASSQFLLTTCRGGAERALKSEIVWLRTDWRPAYMRRGFVTFKCPPETSTEEVFEADPGFAQRVSLSLGKISSGHHEERAKGIWELAQSVDGLAERICDFHVWPRTGAFEVAGSESSKAISTPESEDASATGRSDDDVRSAAREAEEMFLDGVRDAIRNAAPAFDPALQQTSGEVSAERVILDICLVSPEEWWIGWHPVRDIRSHWVGGRFPEALPAHAVSRGYLKIREAIAWSGFKPVAGQTMAEIGCAPGGAAQALMDLGLHVIGVDPASMAPAVVNQPRFRHYRQRVDRLPPSIFVGANWLYVDINLPPAFTLDAVEELLDFPAVNFEGMLLTLKLPDWNDADQIPDHLTRIRTWNFANVRFRQLTMNRQEICVAVS